MYWQIRAFVVSDENTMIVGYVVQIRFDFYVGKCLQAQILTLP